MFNHINGELADACYNKFSYWHEVHVYNTKGANQLPMEQLPMNIGVKGMHYYSAKLWNDIITDVSSFYLFNALFKDMLLDKKLLEEKMTYCI